MGKPQIGILSRGDPSAKPPLPELERFKEVFRALDDLDARPVGVVYAEEVADDVRRLLSELDGVLVWVDPIGKARDGSIRDRSGLDELLRDVARNGVWVSAHPDVILRMGTKQVLYETREMQWGWTHISTGAWRSSRSACLHCLPSVHGS